MMIMISIFIWSFVFSLLWNAFRTLVYVVFRSRSSSCFWSVKVSPFIGVILKTCFINEKINTKKTHTQIATYNVVSLYCYYMDVRKWKNWTPASQPAHAIKITKTSRGRNNSYRLQCFRNIATISSVALRNAFVYYAIIWSITN